MTPAALSNRLNRKAGIGALRSQRQPAAQGPRGLRPRTDDSVHFIMVSQRRGLLSEACTVEATVRRIAQAIGCWCSG